jgi:hypothetical protein
MKKSEIQVTYKDESVTFTFPDGRTIQMYISYLEPDMVTVMASDRIVVAPWATNLVHIKFV